MRQAGSGTFSSWLGQQAGGEEAVQRQEVVCGHGHTDAWLLSPLVSLMQCAPADELSSLVDELLWLNVLQLLGAAVG